MNRREFLQGGIIAAVSGVLGLGGAARAEEPEPEDEYNCYHVPNLGNADYIAEWKDDVWSAVADQVAEPKVTRGEWCLFTHYNFYTDWPLLVVHYQVEIEGESRRLITEQMVDPDVADDQAVIDALLRVSDEEARWAADHPDQVIQAEWVID